MLCVGLSACPKLNRRAVHENAKTLGKALCRGEPLEQVRQQYEPDVSVRGGPVDCSGELTADGRRYPYSSLSQLRVDGRLYVFVPSWGMLHSDSGIWAAVWPCDHVFPSAIEVSHVCLDGE